VNWIQNVLLHIAVLSTLTRVQQRVDSFNVVNWKQKVVFYCAVLLKLIAVQQSV